MKKPSIPRRKRIRPYPPVSSMPLAIGEFGEPWEIAIYGDLTDKQPELIAKLIEIPRNSRGTIFFDSCGGSAYVGLGLASLMLLRGIEADGVVAGECSSAALLPFAACKRRYVTLHSTLLFHPIRWQSDEDVRFEEAEEWARHFRVMEEDLDKLLVKLFDCPTETLEKWTRPGKFVTGNEMVEAGLAKMVDLFAGPVWKQMDES